MKVSMSNNIDFICAVSASNFSSAVDMRAVRVGGLGLRASELGVVGDWGRGGGAVAVEMVVVVAAD